MLQLYHLESKIDSNKLCQKETEDLISEINKKTQREDSMSENEEIIKIQLEQWINDLQKEVELNYKLKHAPKNDKNHTESPSLV